MVELCVSKIFFFYVLVASCEGSFTAESTNWTCKCNNRYGNFTRYPARPGYLEAISFKIFQNLPNMSVKLLAKLPSQTDFQEFVVNLCSLQSSRRQNIFIRLYSDMILPSLKNNVKIKCPIQKGNYEFAERPSDTLVAYVQKYIPPFVKLEGNVMIAFKMYFQENRRNIDICEINEVVILKFT